MLSGLVEAAESSGLIRVQQSILKLNDFKTDNDVSK